MRPRTLSEIAALAKLGKPFDFCLRNFLDEFRMARCGAALESEPTRLGGVVAQGELYDAYLAATAESLAMEHNCPMLTWAWAEDRKLRRPWFALPRGRPERRSVAGKPSAFSLPQSLRECQCLEPRLRANGTTAAAITATRLD
jgi:hypothetical protein